LNHADRLIATTDARAAVSEDDVYVVSPDELTQRASERDGFVLQQSILDGAMIRRLKQSANHLAAGVGLKPAPVAEGYDRASRDDPLRVGDVLLIRHGAIDNWSARLLRRDYFGASALMALGAMPSVRSTSICPPRSTIWNSFRPLCNSRSRRSGEPLLIASR